MVAELVKRAACSTAFDFDADDLAFGEHHQIDLAVGGGDPRAKDARLAISPRLIQRATRRSPKRPSSSFFRRSHLVAAAGAMAHKGCP